MNARIEAMLKHYNRSHTSESHYLREEEVGFHPDEHERWYHRMSLYMRGLKTLRGNTPLYSYFIKNTEYE